MATEPSALPAGRVPWLLVGCSALAVVAAGRELVLAVQARPRRPPPASNHTGAAGRGASDAATTSSRRDLDVRLEALQRDAAGGEAERAESVPVPPPPPPPPPPTPRGRRRRRRRPPRSVRRRRRRRRRSPLKFIGVDREGRRHEGGRLQRLSRDAACRCARGRHHRRALSAREDRQSSRWSSNMSTAGDGPRSGRGCPARNA